MTAGPVEPVATGSDGLRWRRADDLLWRHTLDSVAVARPELDGPDPLLIKGGGVAVWELLDQPRTRDELVDELTHAFDADPATVAADVDALLADLEAQGFVTRT